MKTGPYNPLKVRPYNLTDNQEWLRMRGALWPEIAASGLDQKLDAAERLARPDAVVLVAERLNSGGLAGFAEVGERAYGDGCDTSPVACLEGWYVDADTRRLGIGATLVWAAEDWARGRGHREMASDALLENDKSQRAHAALGFEEVERAVKYRKRL